MNPPGLRPYKEVTTFTLTKGMKPALISYLLRVIVHLKT